MSFEEWVSRLAKIYVLGVLLALGTLLSIRVGIFLLEPNKNYPAISECEE